MTKKTDAENKRRVIREWDVWAKEHVPAGQIGDNHLASLFYLDVQDRYPRWLVGQAWQTMHAWLLGAGKVTRS